VPGASFSLHTPGPMLHTKRTQTGRVRLITWFTGSALIATNFLPIASAESASTSGIKTSVFPKGARSAPKLPRRGEEVDHTEASLEISLE
jgi:hypothetical protein